MEKTNKKRLIWLCTMVFVAVFIYSAAWADFYVVAAGKKAKKTILVSPESTDTASGTALLNAINGITDAGVTNPYLVIIEPGIYDIGTSSLHMKGYVDIQGSGEKVTKITGNIDSISDGVLEGADNAEVRFLTVENTGQEARAIAIYNSSVSPAITHVTASASGAGYTYGLYNNSSSPTMTNVTATASGGGHNYGVYNNNSSSPTMTNVTATASGGTESFGVYNENSSSPTMTNVTATGSGATANYGVYNEDSSSPTMTNVTATGSGGTYCYGVYNETSSSPTMTNVTATASGGSINNNGVYVSGPSSATIHHSVLSGVSAFWNNSSGVTTYIGNTRLDGGVGGTGWTKCAGVYDGDFTFYADTCP